MVTEARLSRAVLGSYLGKQRNLQHYCGNTRASVERVPVEARNKLTNYKIKGFQNAVAVLSV